MARLEIDTCPVCNQPGAPYLKVKDRISLDVFEVSSCDSCCSFFLSDPPEPSELSKYYAEEADSLYWQKPSGTFSFLLDFALGRDLNPLFSKLSQDQLILELGAGTGQICRYIKKRGYQVHAADMYEAELWQDNEIPYSTVDLNGAGIKGLLETVKPQAVVLRHTLEHLYDPKKLMQALSEAEVDFVLIVLPNSESRFRKLFGSNWSFWDAPRHLIHFCPKSLGLLLEATGYEVLSTKIYGTDEIVTSINHMLLTLNKPKKKIANFFHPRGPLTAISAAANFWGNNNICFLAKPCPS